MTRDVRYMQLVEAVLPGVGAWGEGGREDVARWCVDAILSVLAQQVEVTDEMVERAVHSWVVAPGDLVHERMRAALRAALEAEPRPRERTPMTDPNQQITVTATRESWQALTRIAPLSEMTYTPQGIAAFGAYQAIQQALHGPGGPEAGT